MFPIVSNSANNNATGTVTNQVWFNDLDEQTSKLVPVSHMAEIIGDCTQEELEGYDSLEALNAELYGMSFTEEAEYIYDIIQITVATGDVTVYETFNSAEEAEAYYNDNDLDEKYDASIYRMDIVDGDGASIFSGEGDLAGK